VFFCTYFSELYFQQLLHISYWRFSLQLLDSQYSYLLEDRYTMSSSDQPKRADLVLSPVWHTISPVKIYINQSVIHFFTNNNKTCFPVNHAHAPDILQQYPTKSGCSYEAKHILHRSGLKYIITLSIKIFEKFLQEHWNYIKNYKHNTRLSSYTYI